MNKIMYGNIVATERKKSLKKEIEKLTIKPKLLVIQVGDNSSSNVYINVKRKACKNVRIDFELAKFKEDTSEKDIINKIKVANEDKLINGILIQLPLPNNINKDKILNSIDTNKDVDGLTLENIGKLSKGLDCLTPCTPLGIINLLKYYSVSLEGKHAVIIGRSQLVSKPLFNLLLKENATTTMCHSKTKKLKEITKTADILIVSIGRKEFITKEYVKEKSIVIDVGITKENGKLYGDVMLKDVLDKVKMITPVPKGVGPMTVVTLLENVLYAHKKMN